MPAYSSLLINKTAGTVSGVSRIEYKGVPKYGEQSEAENFCQLIIHEQLSSTYSCIIFGVVCTTKNL